MRNRLDLFPITTKISATPNGRGLTIADCDLRALAEQYGTPLYLYDRATLDHAAATYRAALARHYSSNAAITYAGKAGLNLALAQWTQSQKLWLDCTGAGELHIAATAQVSRKRILVHGVNKGPADIAAAVKHGGVIVVDNLTELARIAAHITQVEHPIPELWLRVRPGLAVDTHAFRQTGQEDSKFGMSLAEAVSAVATCKEHNLALTGLHFHQGSHFHDPTPIGPALETVLDLMEELRSQSGWVPQTLCPGGGWGVAYHEDDLPQPSIAAYVEFVAATLTTGCRARDLPLPLLQLEPGRSLVARGGVALYRVGAVKQTANRRWLLIDGGMADNIRPGFYGARYSALPVTGPDRAPIGSAWLAGPYCESGDVMIEDLPLPDIGVGELLAVPASGAYHLGMSSNYNGATKPAVLWLDDGKAHVIQRRESLDDLVARDIPLASL